MIEPSTQRKKYRRRRVLYWLLAACIPLIIVVAFVLRVFAWGSSANSHLAPQRESSSAAPPVVAERFSFGRGYKGDGWQLYFNEPDASVNRADYKDGLDATLGAAIAAARHTLDIAAFELNSDSITEAILDAHERGVTVRMVTDNAHGLEDDKNPQLRRLREAGIAVQHDGRGALMHNKFTIIDGREVWTGSWNYTINGAYRNNNNAFVMENMPAARAYGREFDEMFERREFGPRSSDDGILSFAFGDGEISIIFAPEGDAIRAIKAEIARAEKAIRFMVFVFSLEELAEAMLRQAANPAIKIEGLFEERNSTANWSQLPALRCAGASIRQDGNRYLLHHKVIIIDNNTVITGSFNLSRSAAERNDENILIIREATIAGLYMDEWRRMWDSAEELAPDEVICN